MIIKKKKFCHNVNYANYTKDENMNGTFIIVKLWNELI